MIGRDRERERERGTREEFGISVGRDEIVVEVDSESRFWHPQASSQAGEP